MIVLNQGVSSIRARKDRTLHFLVLLMIISVVTFPDKKFFFIGSQIMFIITMLFYSVKRRYPMPEYLSWCYIFILWSLSSSFWSFSTAAVLRNLVSVIQVMTIGLFLVIFIDNEQKFEFILKAIVFSSILLCIRLFVTSANELGTERIGKSLGFNANTIGLCLSYASISAIYLGRKLRKKFYYLLVIPLVMFSLFTGSRKAFFLITVGISLLLLLTIKKKKRIILALLFLPLFSLVMYELIMNNSMLYNVIGIRIEKMLAIFITGNIDMSTKTRLSMIAQAWEYFLQRPLTGYGLANFAEISPFGGYAHNNYLELLSCTGLIGTLIYYSLPLKVLINSIKKWLKGKREYSIAIVFLTCIFILDWALVSYSGELSQILLAVSFSYYSLIKNREILEKLQTRSFQ